MDPAFPGKISIRNQVRHNQDCLAELMATGYAAERLADWQLVVDAQINPAAFANLYSKYYFKIVGYLRRRVATAELAEELAQEVFLHAFKTIGQFTVGGGSYYSYLIKVARHCLASFYRRPRLYTVEFDRLSERPDSRGNDVAAVLENKLYCEELLAHVAPVQRQALRLHYLEGQTNAEVGRRLGKSENAVKLLLSRARQHLQRLPP